MNKEELAKMLHGRQYRDEMEPNEEQLAKENGLIVIFGASDDLVEFRGLLYDEIDAYEGTHFIIAVPDDEIPVDEDEETFRRAKNLEAVPIREESVVKKNRFEAEWSPMQLDASWLIKTKLPHAIFDIWDDGSFYCRGIVIDSKDLYPSPKSLSNEL